jgi:glutathione S-transferase
MSAIQFYHAPNSRSATTRLLLEELGAPYDLYPIAFGTGEQRKPEYMAVNPMGKVPAIVHNGALVTETVAIFIYLADLFPEANLAPGLTDPLRGPYLRWLVFYAACMEPAFIDRAMQRDPGRTAMCPYGDWDTLMNTILAQLAKGPYLLGDRHSAADVLWGSNFAFLTSFKLMPEHPLITAYLERFKARPAVARAKALDDALAATLPAPAAAA